MIIPDATQALHLLGRYLPASMLVGGGVAGIQHLMAMKREQDKAMDESDQRKDVLVVPVSAKTANVATEAAQSFFHAPEVVAHEVGEAGHVSPPALGTPEWNAQRIDDLFLGRDGGAHTPPASGGGGGGSLNMPIPSELPKGWFDRNWKWLVPTAGAGVGGLGLKNYNDSKGSPSLLDMSAITGIVGGGLMGGYSVINHLIRERKKKVLAEQVDQAKKEYATMLGHTLSKTAGIDAVIEFPVIHGVLQDFARLNGDDSQKNADVSPGMLLLGVPGGLAVLSGIAAHKWVYNRQKELEAMHTASKPAPPKQIRLQAVPPPAAAQDDDDEPLALGAPEPEKIAILEDRWTFVPKQEKEANLGELLQFVNQSDTAALEKEKAEAAAAAMGTAQPKVVKVGPGVVQIATEGQTPIEVEADGPASAAILARKAPQLAKLMAVYQSTPVSAMAA